MQLKKQMKQLQESLQVLKSEISEQLFLIEQDKAHEKERGNEKRFKQARDCSHTA
ncbi:hypothetical protein ACFSY7_03535 [Kurthia populi]|uniref:Uncharacterized protein n=1 Tax=Kurthia populi TaxID=1562132 RepID=A0ABW5XX54_9BACL